MTERPSDFAFARSQAIAASAARIHSRAANTEKASGVRVMNAARIAVLFANSSEAR